jgi:hypothetical protein
LLSHAESVTEEGGRGEFVSPGSCGPIVL